MKKIDHLERAKRGLEEYLSLPAKEHLEVSKVNALISIAEELHQLNQDAEVVKSYPCNNYSPPAIIDLERIN